MWRRGTISLIHKKGETSDPGNFRPITLQPVLGKILGACIRNKLWSYLNSNKLIVTTMQKEFWPGIAGSTEHIHVLKHLLKTQKRHNRDIYVVLMD